VVRSVGGRAATVSTVIDSSTADPHSYSATARDAARVSEADLVVYNAGGYDTFMSDLVDAVGAYDRHGLAAFTAAGHDIGNAHLWYRPGDVARVAAAVADLLERLRPAEAAAFRGNVAEFRDELDSIEQHITRIASAHGGRRVLTTSPLAELLISGARLASVTPPEFTAAVESGHGIPALLQHRVSELLKTGEVAVLVRNEQRSGPVVERLVEVAQAHGVPVVGLSETLSGDARGYPTWMNAQLE